MTPSPGTADGTLPGRPPFDCADAERLAATQYGVRVRARALPSERDRNFHLQGDAGDFVLKLANAGEDRAFLELENRVRAHLRGAPTTAAFVAAVRPARDGQEIGSVAGTDGARYACRLLDWQPGRPLAEVRPHGPELLSELGALLGAVDVRLAQLEEPAAEREFPWDLIQAESVLRRGLNEVEGPEQRALVGHALERFTDYVLPRLGELPRSLIHNDANDHNVLVEVRGVAAPMRIAGLLDFGDMVQGATVGELAVALAYVAMPAADPVSATCAVVSGYHGARPLAEDELEVLFDLVRTRLAVSVCMAAHQRRQEPGNEYLVVSEEPAWHTLERLLAVDAGLARAHFRHVCGLEPVPAAARVIAWLDENRGSFAPVLDALPADGHAVLDLSLTSPALAGFHDPEDLGELDRWIARHRSETGRVGIGRYGEVRLLYGSEQFRSSGGEDRTVHLGADLFIAAGTPVCAPLAGTVHSVADNRRPRDYGPTVFLRHEPEPGVAFFTLYGHLDPDVLEGLAPGDRVAAGQAFARIGAPPDNGGWPPHVHFQLVVDDLGSQGDYPGVATPGAWPVWQRLSPDPSALLGVDVAMPGAPEGVDLEPRRRQLLGRNLSLSYRRPLHIVRGRAASLYDAGGRRYVDLVNNVCHVGHCHPGVARAAAEQMAVLNTNTRYLHDHIVRYAERLVAKLPPPLRVCFFVCTGSEANDLALRLARAHTGRRDVITVAGAYHGHLTSLIEISPYKHDGPGGGGTPGHVHKVAMPDPYRGPYRGADAGARYAEDVGRALVAAEDHGGVAAMICESLLGCGGQVELPRGYLADAFGRVRAAGGVCIADEVQVGFGRVGSHFWGFQTQDVVPDVVTLGKPIGNGHPLAAVVTTPEIAESFANGMEYFNTFGGNPVSCAVGLAVLDAIESEGLQQRAAERGEGLLRGLEGLQRRFPPIGDVRGRGLFVGVELVSDRETREPAAAEAGWIVERMVDQGFLLSTDGPQHNVIKIKPPLVIGAADLQAMVEALGETLAETPLDGFSP